MKKLTLIFLVHLILLFSGCAMVDRGAFPQMGFYDSSLTTWKNSYDNIDTSEEDIGIPKPPVPVVERFEVVNGSCAGDDCGKIGGYGANSHGDRERLELKVHPHIRDTYNGSDYWYTWSIYFPRDFKSIYPAQSTFGQFHAKTIAPFMFTEDNGYVLKNNINGTRTKLVKQEDLRGEWHTVKLHVKWSSDAKEGFFKVLINGKLKAHYKGRTYFSKRPHFKYGIYRCYLSRYGATKKWDYWNSLPPTTSKEVYQNIPDIIVPTQVVYYSNVRRASTEKGLNP